MFPLLRRQATLKGPLGGSRQWTLLWALLIGARLLRRLTKRKPEILLTEKIEPGDTLLISGADREPRVIAGPKPS